MSGRATPSRAGFPAFYTDDSGVPLQLCVDGTARCGGATLRGDGAGGDGVGVAPDGEGFYWMATSSLSTPGGLTLDIEFAAEAAWAARGQPVTFDRVRIRGHAPRGRRHTGDTPYGPFTVTADDPINVRNVNFTEDIGCALSPCNFRDMTTVAGRHITSWITANAAPAGYLGNAVTAQPAHVTGVGAAIFSTLEAGGDSTDRWVVMGKRAARNRVALPTVLNFAKARTRSVTMVNLGTTTRTIRRVTLTGDRTFTKLASSTCRNGKVLAPGARCKVSVRYRPGAARRSTARLNITDNIAAHHVRVRGS